MMKGGRQAKLLAKENQAKKRAEKVFNAFNKESLKKLKAKILPEEVKTPKEGNSSGYNFTESTDTSPGNKEKSNLSKSMKPKRKYSYVIIILKFRNF